MASNANPPLLLAQVSEYDCLLLEFVFGQRPDDALKVRLVLGTSKPFTMLCHDVDSLFLNHRVGAVIRVRA